MNKLKFSLIFLILIVIIISLFTSCKKNEDKSLSATINYDLDEEPISLDPQIANDKSSRIVIRNIFEGLTNLDENMNAIPGIATSWESNAEATEYTFNLRDDCKWSDDSDTTVSANDFVFAFQRLIDPNTKSPLADAIFCIKNAIAIHSANMPVSELGVKASDEHTLKIYLDYPNKDLPKTLSSTACMPCNEKFFNKCGGQYGLECNKVICNGYFSFTNKYSWDHKKNISLSRNDNYSTTNESIPAKINFSIHGYHDDNSSAESYDVFTPNGSEIEKLKNSNVKLTPIEDSTLGFCFNMDDKIMQNYNIRTGLAGAFNRENMIKNLPENLKKAEDIIIPSCTIFSDNYRQMVGYGHGNISVPNVAERIADGLKETELRSLSSITILYENIPSAKTIASNTIETLNNTLGTFFNIEPVTSDELFNRISISDFQIALTSIRATNSNPSKFLSCFKSNAKDNIADLKNPDFDNLISKAENSYGADCAKYCAEAETFLSENAIFYPVVYSQTYFAEAENISGTVFYPYNDGIDFSHTVKKDK